ncbi:MAG: VIT1/CCC1 transporter family protein [Thermoplasmataceae archaeon]
MDSADRKMRVNFLRDELSDMVFYTRLARTIKDPQFSDSLLRLSEIERKHAEFWKSSLEDKGVSAKNIGPRNLKIVFMLLLRWFVGSNLAIKLVEYGEAGSILRYTEYMNGTKETPEFKEKLDRIIEDEIEHEETFRNQLVEIDQKLEWNRNVIYSMSDGLVEVLAALAGLSVVITDHIYVAISGVVVGLGGAMSMTLGAYLSKKNEVDYSVTQLKKNHNGNGGAGTAETKKINMGTTETIRITALTYVIGAAIPILPFVFLSGMTPLIIAILLVGVVQGATNAIAAISVNNRALYSAIRAALLSLLIAAGTFAVGELFHLVFGISFA